MEADAVTLPPRLMAAFDRWNANPPGPAPPWPRSVRLGVDYALQVSYPPETDTAADSWAWTCITLGQLRADDPPGDPPATCAAHEVANRAGRECGQAFDALGRLRDAQAALQAKDHEVPDLPTEAWKILQRAARAERVKPAMLEPVLRQAQLLADQLGLKLLRLPR